MFAGVFYWTTIAERIFEFLLHVGAMVQQDNDVSTADDSADDSDSDDTDLDEDEDEDEDEGGIEDSQPKRSKRKRDEMSGSDDVDSDDDIFKTGGRRKAVPTGRKKFLTYVREKSQTYLTKRRKVSQNPIGFGKMCQKFEKSKYHKILQLQASEQIQRTKKSLARTNKEGVQQSKQGIVWDLFRRTVTNTHTHKRTHG